MGLIKDRHILRLISLVKSSTSNKSHHGDISASSYVIVIRTNYYCCYNIINQIMSSAFIALCYVIHLEFCLYFYTQHFLESLLFGFFLEPFERGGCSFSNIRAKQEKTHLSKSNSWRLFFWDTRGCTDSEKLKILL